MAWLFVLALGLTLAAVVFAATVIFLVTRDRRRRRQARRQKAATSPDPAEPPPVEVSEAADCIQLWLDDQWHQRFGQGLPDTSDTVEG